MFNRVWTKGVFWKRGLFREIHFLEVLENLEILEKPQTLENLGESDHFLETLEKLGILEILEIPLVKRHLLIMTPLFPVQIQGTNKRLFSESISNTGSLATAVFLWRFQVNSKSHSLLWRFPINGRLQGWSQAGWTRVHQNHVRAFKRTFAKPGALWRTHNAILTRTSLTFTRVPAKVSHMHQSPDEGGFCMMVALECAQTSADMLTLTEEPRKGKHSPP